MKKQDGLVRVRILYRVVTGRLAADRHPLELPSGRSQTLLLQSSIFLHALFLASPKKKGQKEGRRSNAAGLLFREPLPWRKRETLP